MNIAIVGASGGIGQALLAQLHEANHRLYCCARRPLSLPAGATGLPLDITNEASISAAAARIAADQLKLDRVIVCSGLLQQADGLQPEKQLRQLETDNFMQLMSVNALGPALVAKHFLPLMRRDASAFFGALSARVGSIGDNRLGGWHSYRASKAALNMLIRNCAIEYRRTHPHLVIAGLHPGTVDTALSAPFQKNVPAGKLFSARFAASRLLELIDGLGPEHSGQCFGWDGEPIAP